MSVGPSPLPSFESFLPDFQAPEGLAQSGSAASTNAPIDRLDPDSELGKKTVERLLEMIKLSANEMSKFHTRWRYNERQYQAFINAKDVEALKKASNERGTPPDQMTITVPYSYATIQTIVTYLLHTFCGRKPMYQVAAYRKDTFKSAKNLETLLQYNIDHSRGIRKYIQFFLDGEKYGVQVIRTLWQVKKGRRTRYKEVSPAGFLGSATPRLQQTQEDAVVFEGNDIYNIDPYCFFPDPRVPMDEVNEKGEFVFWRTWDGIHTLKRAESEGMLKWTAKIPDKAAATTGNLASERQRLAEGEEQPGRHLGRTGKLGKDFIQLDQGTVEIIPSEWGLGESDRYEKWLFTIANESVIIQAEPLDLDHDKHPVIVGEPYSEGYGFGNIGISDMLQPMQDTLTWLINSHMFNVRAVLNNSLVVNPQMVDMADLMKPGPGRIIKLKPAAFGQDPRNAVHQLQVQDITRSHINDMQTIQRLGDMISSVNDNLRGIQDAGGRKTATEVRTAGEAGASRLASHARMVSAQSISPHAEMMALNYQQNMTQEMYLKILGEDAMADPMLIDPQGIAGDFYYPVHDGTLPLDRVAMLEVWKEILMGVITNPLLSQQYNGPGIFEYVAELGGAKNITQFKMQAQPDQMVEGQQQAGNMIPVQQAMGDMNAI